MKTLTVPKGSPEPLAELAAYLEPFAPLFRRATSRRSLERYVTGLLTDLPRKNCESIAQAVANTALEQLQHLLTDRAWATIEPLLPRRGRRGGQWQDHRRVINGILWKVRTGAPWRDLPERYGPWQTCADRALSLATRRAVGSPPYPRADHIGWGGRGGVGGQHRQLHGTRSSACQWRTQATESRRRKKGISHPSDEGLGHSRGGLTTKFHLASDGRGRPLSIVITPGQRHDSTQLQAVLAGIRVPRASGRGRPRTRPDRLIADKGYSYPRCRRWLRQRQIKHTIPERRDQRAQRAIQPGHPLVFDPAIYARRNVVERCINRLKQWRGLATRYEKRAANYRAMVVVASIVIWLDS